MARPELELAEATLDARVARALKARAAFGLALCCAALGRHAQATACLRLAKAVADPRAGVGEAAYGSWSEGRIQAYLGNYALADRLLDAARRGVLAGGSLGEAARCTLQLLAVRIVAGRHGDLDSLGADLRDAFGAEPDAARCAEGVASLARLAARNSPLFDSTFDSINRSFRQVVGSEDRPSLIPSVQMLADSLLVQVEGGISGWLAESWGVA
jgi:tetratricopeptide (TPR) repeat protein